MDRNDADDALRKAKLLFLTLRCLICKRLAVSWELEFTAHIEKVEDRV